MGVVYVPRASQNKLEPMHAWLLAKILNDWSSPISAAYS